MNNRIAPRIRQLHYVGDCTVLVTFVALSHVTLFLYYSVTHFYNPSVFLSCIHIQTEDMYPMYFVYTLYLHFYSVCYRLIQYFFCAYIYRLRCLL